MTALPPHLDGVPEIFPELVRLYQEQAPLKILSMREALCDQNAEKLLECAHFLKSSAANLGFNQVSELCDQLESLARHHDFEQARLRLAALEKAIEICLKFDICKPATL